MTKQPPGPVRSIFSITLFVVLLAGVSFLGWSFVQALLAKLMA